MKLYQFSRTLFQFLAIALFTIVLTCACKALGASGLLPAQSASAGSGAGAANPELVPAPQDPQAMSVLNQVLAGGGGAPAIAAVSDYTATGSVEAGGLQHSMTIRGLLGSEFRIDVSSPEGTYSSGVDQGMVFSKAVDGTVSRPQQSNGHPNPFALPVWTPLYPAGFAFPSAFVGNIVSATTFGVSYIGTTTINGHTVHDIRITAGPFTAASQSGTMRLGLRQTRDLFIDTSTFQIVAFRETVPRNPIHEVDYSNYEAVNGVLMPFTIYDSYGGQAGVTIQINQIVFNTGLQQSDFAVQ